MDPDLQQIISNTATPVTQPLTCRPLQHIDSNLPTPVGKKKSNKNCAVPHCTKSGYRFEEGHGKVTYHKFPADPHLKKQWLIKIKRDESANFVVKAHSFVCSLHFKPEDYEIHTFSGHRRLKPGAVPQLFDCWNNIPSVRKEKIARKPNKLMLNKAKHETEHNEIFKVDMRSEEILIEDAVLEVDSFTGDSGKTCSGTQTDLEDALAKEIEKLKLENEKLLQERDLLKQTNEKQVKHIDNLKSANVKCEAQLKKSEFSIDNIKDEDISFYTGLPSRSVFDVLFQWLNPGQNGENIQLINSLFKSNESQETENVKRGRPCKLTRRNQFFLFLCRVRLGLLECDLSYRFNISVSTVSNIIITWANFLYVRLGSLNIWQHKEGIQSSMPDTFKEKYPSTRVIIDCTEIKIQMPSSLVLKSKTYSNYKGCNTLKGLIGIAPSGAVTFVSQLYLGSISDREITQRSGLLNLPFDIGDVLMADKGFEIQDLLDPLGVKLNIPPFLGRQDQMPAVDVIETQQIAAERIHVERAINKIKNFHIFDGVIPLNLAGTINQIWSVCAMLTLFQNPIISCPVVHSVIDSRTS